LEKGQTGITGNDPLRASIEALFDGKIGPSPSDQKHLDDIYKSGQDRYKRQIPPGYKDDVKDKDGYHIFNGLTFERKYGDLILWEQLLNEVKTREVKHVIFITDDNKEDWWWTVESKGSRITAARRELVEEMRNRAGVELYSQYSSVTFLKYAPEYLGTEVKPDSVQQVREISKRTERFRQRRLGSQAVELVFEWAKEHYYPDHVIMQTGYPDIIVTDSGGRTAGLEVQYLWDYAEMRRRTSPKFFELLLSRGPSKTMPITIVFVAADQKLASITAQTLEVSAWPSNYMVGTISDYAGTLRFSELVVGSASR
jgi:hypothetical protein